MDIAKILILNRDPIIKQWVKKLSQDVSPNYSVQPLELLQQTVTAAADANFDVLAHHDFAKIDAFIEWIGKLRSKDGFYQSEVQNAFEIYRVILVPLLAREMGVEELVPAIERLNALLSFTVHRFSDYYQDLHEAKIREYSQSLEVKVKKRTSQLTESEAKYRTLVEKIRDGYFVNQQGKILFANKSFCAMHGYTKKETIGRQITDFIAPESRSEVQQIYEERMQKKDSREQYVYFRLHKSGAALPTENTVTLATYQGKMAAIGICRDITERVEIEKRMREAESLARIGHLTTSLAHEIRNPLSSAKMSIQMILKNDVYQGMDRRRLEILSQQISRLEKIVTEMLDLARPIEFEFMPAVITEVIDNCLEVLDAKIDEKQIHVTRSFSKNLSYISMDREKMEQAIINLLLNSIEAVDNEGQISVGARYLRKTRVVEVEIADNGCGVNPEDLPYIFDPFVSKKARGTGLGLANAQRIVEAHQGSIQASPGKDGGMRFSFVFPSHPDRNRTNNRRR